jgi:hypothetical protein
MQLSRRSPAKQQGPLAAVRFWSRHCDSCDFSCQGEQLQLCLAVVPCGKHCTCATVATVCGLFAGRVNGRSRPSMEPQQQQRGCAGQRTGIQGLCAGSRWQQLGDIQVCGLPRCASVLQCACGCCAPVFVAPVQPQGLHAALVSTGCIELANTAFAIPPVQKSQLAASCG